jgi:hypothetical protein
MIFAPMLSQWRCLQMPAMKGWHPDGIQFEFFVLSATKAAQAGFNEVP